MWGAVKGVWGGVGWGVRVWGAQPPPVPVISLLEVLGVCAEERREPLLKKLP